MQDCKRYSEKVSTQKANSDRIGCGQRCKKEMINTFLVPFLHSFYFSLTPWVLHISSIPSLEDSHRAIRLGDSNVSGTRGLVTLGGDDLVVVGTELQAKLSPGVEVVSSSNSTRRTLVLADAPVLVEGSGTGDGGLVGANALVDIVGGAVRGYGAHVLETAAGVVGAVGLENVVLDQGVLAPAVDGEVRVTLGRVGTLEVDVAGGTLGPTLASDEVVALLPRDTVFTSTLVVVVDGTATFLLSVHVRDLSMLKYELTSVPEGVVVTVVLASASRGGALDQRGKTVLDGLSDRGCQSGDEGRSGNEERSEVHICGVLKRVVVLSCEEKRRESGCYGWKRRKREMCGKPSLLICLFACFRFASVDPGQNTRNVPIKMATLLSRARYAGSVITNRRAREPSSLHISTHLKQSTSIFLLFKPHCQLTYLFSAKDRSGVDV
jgi:hypothetical protein